MKSQTAFINGLFKNESLFESIINTFCRHPERIIKEAKMDRMKNKVVGMLIILISEMVQNNKVKGNKKAKEAISAFFDSYLFNGIDIVEELFIKRRGFKEEDFDMSLKSLDFRRRSQILKYSKKEGQLEQNVKDICFYNYVVSSYLLIVSNLLITFEKDNENKNRALKLLTILYKQTFHNLIELATTKRITSTGEVMKEFHDELIKLGQESSLNVIDNNYDANFPG